MSGSDPEHLKRLEKDFNRKMAFDLRDYKNVLEQAAAFGFGAYDALEASIVCNTQDNMQVIIDYILSAPQVSSYCMSFVFCSLGHNALILPHFFLCLRFFLSKVTQANKHTHTHKKKIKKKM